MSDPSGQRDDFSDSSSITDPLDTRDDEGWEDVEQDEEQLTLISLFDSETFSDPRRLLESAREKHGFDIWRLRQDHGLDFFGLIKLINYVRSEVKNGNTNPDTSSKSLFDDDKNLKPVLEDDVLLFSLDEVFDDEANNSGSTNEVEQLREQLAALQSQFTAYREQVQSALLDGLEGKPDVTGPSSSSSGKAQQAGSEKDKTAEGIEKGYFESYAYNAIHESMIKDTIRTDAYRDFMYDHKDLFKGKTVLDVGCGTGILSMFCAKAGAKLVIAVDNSDIIDKARENIFKNGFQDTIKCLRGKIEDVTLPVEKVDIIVSEWMGYVLLYESMLDSVFYARDKYLAEDGLMVPSHATLRIAPLADSELKADYIDFWRNVYGFDMTAMLDKAHDEALVRVVDEKELGAESVAFLNLDLHRASLTDLVFTKPFAVKWRDGFKNLEGFIVWFDIIFATSKSEDVPPGLTAAKAKERGLTAFSTGSHSKATHWMQGVFLIEDPIDQPIAGTDVTGEVTYIKKQGQERSLDIEISWKTSEASPPKRQMWVVD
ncbi:hypothetical protein B0A52_04447 [Exophiala mesophila]|uniref:type I protein arginine methyltransferase n=1 Tax=Exophiala mesophila TaxID=212818 RepID=A0A438N8Y5_EXOME|nr:hypothetical protein B0A52_04447 [Exophiala mesophila]